MYSARHIAQNHYIFFGAKKDRKLLKKIQTIEITYNFLKSTTWRSSNHSQTNKQQENLAGQLNCAPQNIDIICIVYKFAQTASKRGTYTLYHYFE
mmetsp:Transcript_8609/g.10628  ORF Transcript_8609/g.10628 Transcript_8609/m.10628 type:complete len:95 (-) Transcript_8609:107-391(-)